MDNGLCSWLVTRSLAVKGLALLAAQASFVTLSTGMPRPQCGFLCPMQKEWTRFESTTAGQAIGTLRRTTVLARPALLPHLLMRTCDAMCWRASRTFVANVTARSPSSHFEGKHSPLWVFSLPFCLNPKVAGS